MTRTSLLAIFTTVVACGGGSSATPDGRAADAPPADAHAADAPPACSVPPGRRAIWHGTPVGGVPGVWLVDAESGAVGCAADLVDAPAPGPGALLWSPARDQVALIGATSATLFDVSAATPSAHTVPIPAGADVRYSRSGAWLVTVAPGPDPRAVAAVRTDVAGATPVALGALDEHGSVLPWTFGPTGDHFVLLGSGAALHVDLAAAGGPKATTWTLPAGGGGPDPAWSPDGRWVAIVHGVDDGLGNVFNETDVFDASAPSAPPIHVPTHFDDGPTFAGWAPDSHRFTLVRLGPPGTLEVVDIASGAAVSSSWSLPIDAGNWPQPWIDAGHFLAFLETDPSTFDVVDAATGDLHPLVTGVGAWRPVPHRAAIAVRTNASQWSLVPFDGSPPTPLGACGLLDWSPDGATAVCNEHGVARLIATATGATLGTVAVPSDSVMIWSPDSALAWLAPVTPGAPPALLDLATRTVSGPTNPAFSSVDTTPQWQPAP